MLFNAKTYLWQNPCVNHQVIGEGINIFQFDNDSAVKVFK